MKYVCFTMSPVCPASTDQFHPQGLRMPKMLMLTHQNVKKVKVHELFYVFQTHPDLSLSLSVSLSLWQGSWWVEDNHENLLKWICLVQNCGFQKKMLKSSNVTVYVEKIKMLKIEKNTPTHTHKNPISFSPKIKGGKDKNQVSYMYIYHWFKMCRQ